MSGYKRCKRFGTFGLSSYGNLGAENLHPISPLTTTLTYGPIDPATGQVVVKLIYDHRVLDGAYIARRLRDIEEALNGPIRNELRIDLEGTNGHRDGPPPNVEPLLKPHLPTTRPGPRAERPGRGPEAAVIRPAFRHGPIRDRRQSLVTRRARRPPDRSSRGPRAGSSASSGPLPSS